MLNKICMLCLNSSSDSGLGWSSAYFSLSILLCALHRLRACWSSLQCCESLVLLFSPWLLLDHKEAHYVSVNIWKHFYFILALCSFLNLLFLFLFCYSCSEQVRETFSKIIICHQTIRYGVLFAICRISYYHSC